LTCKTSSGNRSQKKSSGVGAAHSQSDRTTQHKTNHKNILHANYFFIRAKVFHRFSFVIHSRFRTLIDARSYSPQNALRTAAPRYLLDAHAVTLALALKNSQCHNKRRKGE
jgi:hypothetical protein